MVKSKEKMNSEEIEVINFIDEENVHEKKRIKSKSERKQEKV